MFEILEKLIYVQYYNNNKFIICFLSKSLDNVNYFVKKGQRSALKFSLCIGSEKRPDYKGLLYAALPCTFFKGCFQDLNT